MLVADLPTFATMVITSVDQIRYLLASLSAFSGLLLSL